jgi:hypothetical protein
MDRRRNGARVHGFPNQFPCARPVGFGSQVLDTMKGVLGPMPVFPSPARRSRSPLARRFNSASPSARSAMTDSTSGGYRIPTRVCLRVTKGTSEVDTVR